jgi:hypothetical protein
MPTRTSRNATQALTGGQSDKISEYKASGTRVVLLITNLNAAGGDSVFISIGTEAKLNQGIQLLPGQSVTFSKDSGYTPSQDIVSAYAANAGSNIGIYEEIEGR